MIRSNKKRGRGRPKNIESMNLIELLESMQQDFKAWQPEIEPWDFEALALHNDMGAVNDLKKLFRATGLDEVASTEYLLREVYEDRLEQLAERERFRAYVEQLHRLLIQHNLILSPAGLKYIKSHGTGY